MTGSAKQWWLYVFPPLVWAGGLFGLSSITFPPDSSNDWLGFSDLVFNDKAMHALLYAVFALLIFRAFRGRERLPAWRAALLAFLLAAAYGVTDEIHQFFVPGRECDLADWLADLIGASVVVVPALFYAGRERRS